MIKGSHNTMSYLRDRRWWMRPFDIWSRCQSKTLKEQWESGVRYFDLRVRLVNDKWQLCHGLTEYKQSIFDVLSYLSRVNKRNENAYIRVLLEINKADREQEWRFFELEELLIANYKQFDFFFHIKCRLNRTSFTGCKDFVEISKQHDIKYHAAIPPKYWLWEQDRIERAIKQAGFHGIVAKDFV